VRPRYPECKRLLHLDLEVLARTSPIVLPTRGIAIDGLATMTEVSGGAGEQ
jgi:hypothetical protein